MPGIDVHIHVPGVMKKTGCPISEIKSHSEWTMFKKAQHLLEDFGLPHLLRDLTLQLVGEAKKIDSGVLLAMDNIYKIDENKQVIACPDNSELHVSNESIAECVQLIKEKYGKTAYLGASIHPARPDALDELHKAFDLGAVLVKWIPSVQNIELERYFTESGLDEIKKRVEDFFQEMARLKIPLLCHLGREHTIPPAFHDDTKQRLNDPKILTYILNAAPNLKVIGAHCAMPIAGDKEIDLLGPDGKTDWQRFLDLFKANDNIYGDVAAYFLTPWDARLPEHLAIVKDLSNDSKLGQKLLLGSDVPSISFMLSAIKCHKFNLDKLPQSPLGINSIDKNVNCFIEAGFDQRIFTNAEQVLRLPPTTASAPSTKALVASNPANVPTTDSSILINCHTHITNFDALLSSGTTKILLERLKRDIRVAITRKFKTKLKSDIDNIFNAQTPVSHETIIEYSSKSFSDNFSNISNAALLMNNLDAIFADMLNGKQAPTEILFSTWLKDNYSNLDWNSDVHDVDLNDIMQFLRLGFAGMDENADELFKMLGDDALAVVLTLDFCAKTESNDTDKKFRTQLESTVKAVLKYPGRLLPFYAVNPHRNNFLQRLKAVLGESDRDGYNDFAGAFVGIKLYPSSGYSLDELGNDFFEFCTEKDIPIIMHCNRGGFSIPDAVDFCAPDELEKHLQKYPSLRICFAHFGGAEGLCQSELTDAYTIKIIELLQKYDHVYADISYHTDPMESPDHEGQYFVNLNKFLNDDKIKTKILFGTDFYLVRQQAKDCNYIEYFKEKLTPDEFMQISFFNPIDFLGLPLNGKTATPIIKQYADFLYARKNQWAANTGIASWMSSLKP